MAGPDMPESQAEAGSFSVAFEPLYRIVEENGVTS
jgi:hypothetical protein